MDGLGNLGVDDTLYHRFHTATRAQPPDLENHAHAHIALCAFPKTAKINLT